MKHILMVELGLWELCSEFLSLFYSKFLLKWLHYAQFYSFYAYDLIIILHVHTVNYSTPLVTYILKYRAQKLSSQSTSLSVAWSLAYSESLTFTASSTVSEVGMNLFCYFSHLFFWQFFLLQPILLSILLDV